MDFTKSLSLSRTAKQSGDSEQTGTSDMRLTTLSHGRPRKIMLRASSYNTLTSPLLFPHNHLLLIAMFSKSLRAARPAWQQRQLVGKSATGLVKRTVTTDAASSHADKDAVPQVCSLRIGRGSCLGAGGRVVGALASFGMSTDRYRGAGR
jgi:hypothetical protein